jgi:chaperonin GroEL (HSP60 family)
MQLHTLQSNVQVLDTLSLHIATTFAQPTHICLVDPRRPQTLIVPYNCYEFAFHSHTPTKLSDEKTNNSNRQQPAAELSPSIDNPDSAAAPASSHKKRRAVHPLHTLVVDLARAQFTRCKDGTATVVLLAAACLRRAHHAIRQYQLSPQLLSHVYAHAFQLSLTFLDSHKVPFLMETTMDNKRVAATDERTTNTPTTTSVSTHTLTMLLKLLETSLKSKIQSTCLIAQISRAAVAAFYNRSEEDNGGSSSSSSSSTNTKPIIKVQEVTGPMEIHFLAALLIEFHDENSNRTLLASTFVAVPLSKLLILAKNELYQPQERQGIQYSRASDKLAFSAQFKRLVDYKIQRIANCGCSIVCVVGNVDPYCMRKLAESHIFCLSNVRKRDVSLLVKCTGAKIVYKLNSSMSKSDLEAHLGGIRLGKLVPALSNVFGSHDIHEIFSITNSKFAKAIVSESNPKSNANYSLQIEGVHECSSVLCSAWSVHEQHMIQAAFQCCLASLDNAQSQPYVVCGGGSLEMKLACHIRYHQNTKMCWS